MASRPHIPAAPEPASLQIHVQSISMAITCSTKGTVNIYYFFTHFRVFGSDNLTDTLHGFRKLQWRSQSLETKEKCLEQQEYGPAVWASKRSITWPRAGDFRELSSQGCAPLLQPLSPPPAAPSSRQQKQYIAKILNTPSSLSLSTQPPTPPHIHWSSQRFFMACSQIHRT